MCTETDPELLWNRSDKKLHWNCSEIALMLLKY